MKTHRRFALIACGLLPAVLLGCGPGTGYVVKPVALDETLQESTVRSDGVWVSDKIAVIDLDGVIMNQRTSSLMGSGENPVSLFVEKFDIAARDRLVKAVVIRINSPGGGVTASDILYRAVKRFGAKRPGVPVIAVIQDVGASGAYYVACAADKIVAHPTALVGSIGVIVQMVSFAGTMEKLGITAQAVTSGRYKDMGSPLKPLDKDDRAILQTLVDDYYGNFVKVVAAGRPGLDEQKVRQLADGRVWSAAQARTAGLVDALADMEEAIEMAQAACGSRRVRIVMYDRPWGSRASIYSQGAAASPKALQVGLMNVSFEGMLDMTRPRFLYLWTGRR